MEFFFLDAGPKMYGDCILCRKDDDLILIDGGHPGDQRARTDSAGKKRAALQDQMAAVLGTEGPFALKLLVVTHAHLDHIGCLPALVKDGIITVEWALVADENLGWGKTGGGDGGADAGSDLPADARAVLAALREDAVPPLTDAAAVEAFIADAATLEQGYKEMLKKLADDGTKICRYGRDDTTELLAQFRRWKLKILGPTKDHLIECAKVIGKALSDAAGRMRNGLGRRADGAFPDRVGIFRELLAGGAQADADGSRPGFALNDQSIVLSFGGRRDRVLLAGDMQFVEPGIPGIRDEMAELWETVKDNGKYLLIKTCHHTSHNGIDVEWIRDMGWEALLVHSGGEDRDDHPHRLEDLKQRGREVPGKWLRTDRNGIISCVVEDGELTVEKQRGRFDDFTPNVKNDGGGGGAERPLEKEPQAGGGTNLLEKPAAPGGVKQGAPPGKAEDSYVEVNVRVPNQRTRVTVTIDVDPGAAAAPKPPGFPKAPVGQAPVEKGMPGGGGKSSEGRKLGGGRKFPKLLAVTDRDLLAANVGGEAADEAIRMLHEAGLDVITSLPAADGGSLAARNAVRGVLLEEPGLYLGVLLIGGHDVVPHVVVDCLPESLRKQVEAAGYQQDEDDYIVWSDHQYGELDDVGPNELPVSRVPDGHSAELLLAALSAPAVHRREGSAFCLRNLNRPFAEAVFHSSLSGEILTSAKTVPRTVPADSSRAQNLYLMLHGAAEDATCFNGEVSEEDVSQIPAFDLLSLPDDCAGSVVFTGCCWGALTVDTTAAESGRPEAPRQRSAEDSIAMAFLRGGARAYIGCTGTHYSPFIKPYAFFGGPMHSAFWKGMAEPGMPPALALYQARISYLNGLPHGQTEASAQAIEYKTFHQFTCLGLGW